MLYGYSYPGNAKISSFDDLSSKNVSPILASVTDFIFDRKYPTWPYGKKSVLTRPG
jgi:hypothetical protein